MEIKAIVRLETSGSKFMPCFYDFMENNDKYMFKTSPSCKPTSCKLDFISNQLFISINAFFDTSPNTSY